MTFQGRHGSQIYKARILISEEICREQMTYNVEYQFIVDWPGSNGKPAILVIFRRNKKGVKGEGSTKPGVPSPWKQDIFRCFVALIRNDV